MNSQILNIISGLKELLQLLEKSEKSGSLPGIEIDIAKAKLQQIYETLLHLKLSQSSDSRIIETKMPETESENNLTENIKNSEVANDDLMQLDDSTTKETNENQTDSGQNSEIKVKEEMSHQQEAFTGKEILAERFHKNQNYVNELLAQGFQKKDISSLMQSKPIKDIEAAIGINEKFLFTRELFSGDEETYLKTIRILNNAANFNEAFNYIHNTFNWNIKGEAAQKLLELVRRRFIVEED